MSRMDAVDGNYHSTDAVLDDDGSLVEGDSDFDDFEDLPAHPEDEENVEDGSSAPTSVSIPFTRIHEDTLPFSDPKQRMLVPNSPVTVTIVDVEQTSGSHLLNPYLYVLQLQHHGFEWTVKRRYNNFLSLHQQLRLFSASLKVPLPTKRHKERRKSVSRSNRRPLPRFPRKPEALVSLEELEDRRKQMEEYLKKVLKIPMYRNYHEMMNFLEISPLSFVNELGHKGREGLIRKRAGGHQNAPCCVRLSNCFTDICGNWRKRWLVIKDTFVVYLRPRDGKIRSVLLIDQDFKAKCGLLETGVTHGVLISNLTRDLVLKSWTKRKAQEWVEHINESAQKFGRDFTQSNRFDSFAPIRLDTDVKWFIDGANYFDAIADVLDQAQQEIFITDWWLSPEIYLKRPVMQGDYWRLDKVLQRKARQGVKVFVLLFKEVEFALGINSLYSKQQLMKQHPNIKVLRHPDPVRGGPLFWSHHEKTVIVDQSHAFVGGVDLCFGRWDNLEHRLTDLGGITLDSGELGNAPFKTSVFPLGGALLKMSAISQPIIVADDEKLNLKSFPQKTYNSTQIKNVDNNQNSQNQVKKQNPLSFKSSFGGELKDLTLDDEIPPKVEQETTAKTTFAKKMKTQRVIQAVARLNTLRRMRKRGSDESLNFAKSESKENLRRTISDTALNDIGIEGGVKLWFGKDYVNFIVKDFVDLNLPFHDLVDRNTTPRMPWHDMGLMVKGAAARDVARHFVERWNFTKFEKAQFNDRYPWLLPKSYQNLDSIPSLKCAGKSFKGNCQVVRSASSWSIGSKVTESSILKAYLDAIHNAEHYVYIENQFFITQTKAGNSTVDGRVMNEIGEALYRRIIRAYRSRSTFRVYVIIPLLPAFEGEVGTNKGNAIQVITHYNMASICRGSDSLLQRLEREMGGEITHYISFFGLRNYSLLHGRLVSELIYVHSKLMIVDDLITIIGSSNINDRSMVGFRDSEVAVVVNDTETEESLMNGKKYASGRFSGSLRRTLFKEHLGLMSTQNPRVDVRDPVSDKFYREVWLATAAENTSAFETVFGVIPSDQVRTYAQLKNHLSKSWLASTDHTKALEMVKTIKGHLVFFPLFFLRDEDLQPSAGSKEALMPDYVWT